MLDVCRPPAAPLLQAVPRACLDTEGAAMELPASLQLFSMQTNLIPRMEWERRVNTTLGMSADQTRFALAFFGACAAGMLLRMIKSPARECGARQHG